MSDDPGRGGDAADEVREAREHEQEAREREPGERAPAEGDTGDETPDMPGMED